MRNNGNRLKAYERIVATYRSQGMTLAEANRKAFVVIGPWEGRRDLSMYPPKGPRCERCGTDLDLILDHVIPRSRGGWDVPSNLQTLCSLCNLMKGAKDTDYRCDAPVSSADTVGNRRAS